MLTWTILFVVGTGALFITGVLVAWLVLGSTENRGTGRVMVGVACAALALVLAFLCRFA